MKTVVIHGRRWRAEYPGVEHPDAEVWGITTGQRKYNFTMERWDRWFDTHDPEHTDITPGGIRLRRPDMWEWYTRQRRGIIYLSDTHPDIPQGVAYPFEQVERFFSPWVYESPVDPWYSGSLELAIALAMMEGFERIVLDGIGILKPKTEDRLRWIALHRGVLWWIGFCQGQGIEIQHLGPSVFRFPPGRMYGQGENGLTLFGEGKL